MMDDPELLTHYRSRVCATQWRGFMLALRDEFQEALPEPDLFRLMARIGHRFGQVQVLPAVTSLDELLVSANAAWAALDWGYARFEEKDDRILIRHFASPLAAGLGHAAWADGFLEGVYRTWFQAAGMANGLDVRASASTTPSPDSSLFVLSRIS